MGIIETVTLFGMMALLAAIPSTSVALVVTRSATSGIANGVAVAAGIVVGDLVFIALAIFGLSVVAATLGHLFMAIKYFGAVYLIWLGISLLRTGNHTKVSVTACAAKGRLTASFLSGLALTLGDIKAVFFYVSLFPVFIDLTRLQVVDLIAIVSVTLAGVGGVKIIYAVCAIKIASWAQGFSLEGFSLENTARKTLGGIMIGAGGYLIAKA